MPTTGQQMPTDEDLVAYIDGELPLDARQAIDEALAASPELCARLEELHLGDRPFREAFDLLLDQAPVERMLARLSEQSTPVPVKPVEGPRTDWRAAGIAAMILLSVGLGFAVGWGAKPVEEKIVEIEKVVQVTPAKGWRQAVADYQALFITESLTPDQGDGAALALVSERLGLPLDKAAVDAGGVSFRRATLLAFNGKELAQLAYLGDDGVPLAFCILRSANADAAPAFEVRNDLGIVHWVENGYGYMLIGKLPEQRLDTIAADLRDRVRL